MELDRTNDDEPADWHDDNEPFSDEGSTEPPPRPYFIPAGVDFETLPEAVRQAFNDIIHPLYEALVLRATSPLQRSSGASLVFLATLEVLEQFRIGSTLELKGHTSEPSEGREKAIGRLLRLSGAKQKGEEFLLRLEQLRRKVGYRTSL